MMDKFKIAKKGYDKNEVDVYVLRTEEALSRQKARIETLVSEAESIQAENAAFRQKEALISQSLLSATEKAEEIESAAKKKYAADMSSLTAFHEQWLSYYKKLLERYPLDEELLSLNAFGDNLAAILTSDTDCGELMAEAELQFKRENERLTKRYGVLPLGDDDEELEFNPEQSIRALLRRQALEEEQKRAKKTSAPKPAPKAKENEKKKPKTPVKDDVCAAADNDGFSYEECLNPTQSLSEILGDLGIELKE